MKRKVFGIVVSLLAIVAVLAGCGSNDEETTVKVGLNGSGIPIWEFIKEKAADEGINIELTEFSDYVRPNDALADGDIDLNAFQTVSYFDSFIEERDYDLVPIATTMIAPMGFYSEKIDDVGDVPGNAQIAVPQEATNLGRALLLAEQAGLITLEDGFDGNGDLSAIVENPKNIEFVPMVAAQTARVLPDVTGAIINNGVAVEAGFVPVQDAVFIEDDTATPYINIIAAQGDEKDKEAFQKIVDIYQTDEVEEYILEVYNESLIPTFVPLEQIGW
ncbi:MetQ/NlpA family ABC transporter substrate-binding protein [Gracilibacillus sp. S3-1-1]|uniref:MetQ/NlpA family ABC transporter substrate-binding protein n=1 Tax=Gracilibacillus pellucidus TaxID=3095368 RepID=A0ACC6M3R4_9BACI|nr:MetQ/NlpA family ABC transporter substrate-binding protein [Gracilibacillus sp. S3-1-1]MDX8045577.1 MetQ/NlpA family ABC transporter substrate-binding protein [Gracilibacillus sp. S3-1-1]